MIETNRTYKVEVSQGQTFTDQLDFFELVDGVQTALDFTGKTAGAVIADGSLQNSWTLDTTISGNRITISCETSAEGDIPAIAPGAYIITVYTTDVATGDIDVYINGTFVVNKSALGVS